jgi:DNA-binding PadR family transcriptional regulator
MLLRYAILGLLEGEDLHGYRIKSVFEERIGPFWSLNFGQIYQTLKDLKRRGLVEGRFDQGDSHIGRWVYSVTPKGRRALDTWLKRSPRSPQPIRDEIFIRLLVLDRKELAPSLAQLANQEHVYREYLTRLTAHRRSLEPLVTEERLLNSLAADAALFHAEAHLKWLDHCAAVLKAWSASALGAEPSVAERARSAAARSTAAGSLAAASVAESATAGEQKPGVLDPKAPLGRARRRR